MRISNLSRQLPPLGTLVVFEAAYRLGSFSRAGDEVALSQASVSRQIRQLEANLGVQLFDRRRHDVQATPEGDALAATVQLTLRELASTANQLRSTGKQKNRFTVFSDISIARYIITPILNEFQRQHPSLQLRVLSSYELIEKVTDHFDIGFQVGRTAEDRFNLEAIADDAVFPVCSPAFAHNLPRSITADDLAKYPLLHLEDLGHGWPSWSDFLAWYEAHNTSPADDFVFNSYQVCLSMAEQGEGIALGWARSVQSKLYEGKLVRIPGMVMQLPDSIYVYRSKLSPANPIAEEFIETIRSQIKPVNI